MNASATPERNTVLVRGGHVVVNDAAGTILDPGSVLIRDGRIAAVWPGDGPAPAAAGSLDGVPVVEARGFIVIPGLVNAHMHSNESFEQGAYDALTLETWLVHTYPPFGAPLLTPRDQYLRTMLCAIQSLRSGVTTIQDDFLDEFGEGEAFDAIAAAYRDAGLRAVVTTSFLDTPFLDGRPFLKDILPPDLARELSARAPTLWQAQMDLYARNRRTWHQPDGLTSVILGPISPQRCTEDLLRAIAAVSAADGVPVHCHVDETRTQALTSRMFYGASLVEHLDAVGLLTDRLSMNHAIWLTERDVDMMGERRVSITHNPLSNLKLGSGTCNVPRLVRAGVNVALGTDGTTTSDTPDLIEALRLASLLHRMPNSDESTWVTARDAFRMATVGGAVSTGLAGEIGTLEAGRAGDLVLLDRRHLGFVPLNDAIRQLAFSATSEAVHTVLVAGRVVLENRRLALLDEDAIRAEIAEAAERFRTEHRPAMARGTARVLPYIEEMQRRARATPLDAVFVN